VLAGGEAPQGAVEGVELVARVRDPNGVLVSLVTPPPTPA
jgi:hypothetical protein